MKSQEDGTVDAIAEAAEDTDIRRDLFRALAAADIPILMMRSLDMSLEDIFLNLTTKELTTKEADSLNSNGEEK